METQNIEILYQWLLGEGRIYSTTPNPDMVTMLEEMDKITYLNLSPALKAVGSDVFRSFHLLRNLTDMEIWHFQEDLLEYVFNQLNLEELQISIHPGQKNLWIEKEDDFILEVGKMTNLKKIEIHCSREEADIERQKHLRIPENIGNLVNLEELHIVSDKLRKLPGSISKLKSLKKLFISSENADILPPGIGGLDGLNSLCLLTPNEPTSPEDIENLCNLRELWLNFQNVRMEFDRLTNLEWLSINTKIIEVPYELSCLENLTNFDFHFISHKKGGYDFFDGIESAGSLKGLKSLRIRTNRLKKLPEWLGELKNLRSLEIDYVGDGQDYSVKKLPVVIRKLGKLRHLTLYQFNMKYIQSWISELRELNSIYLYYSDIERIPKSMKKMQNLRNIYFDMYCVAGYDDSVRKLIEDCLPPKCGINFADISLKKV